MDIVTEYAPAPPQDTKAERAEGRKEKEKRFVSANLILKLSDTVVVDQREIVDQGHPARMVYTEEGTFLVTVKWLGPQTLV